MHLGPRAHGRQTDTDAVRTRAFADDGARLLYAEMIASRPRRHVAGLLLSLVYRMEFAPAPSERFRVEGLCLIEGPARRHEYYPSLPPRFRIRVDG